MSDKEKVKICVDLITKNSAMMLMGRDSHGEAVEHLEFAITSQMRQTPSWESPVSQYSWFPAMCLTEHTPGIWPMQTVNGL